MCAILNVKTIPGVLILLVMGARALFFFPLPHVLISHYGFSRAKEYFSRGEVTQYSRFMVPQVKRSTGQFSASMGVWRCQKPQILKSTVRLVFWLLGRLRTTSLWLRMPTSMQALACFCGNRKYLPEGSGRHYELQGDRKLPPPAPWLRTPIQEVIFGSSNCSFRTVQNLQWVKSTCSEPTD